MEIDFSDNLNIISGETASGKSLIIKAISVLSGNTPPKGFLRKDCTEGFIEGIFIVNGEEIAVRRTLGDKSKIFLNNHLSTLKNLKETLKNSITISSQNHQLKLKENSFQKSILNKEVPKEIIQEIGSIYNEIKALEKEKENLSSIDGSKLDFIDFQVEELSKHNFREDEYDHLSDQIKDYYKNKQIQDYQNEVIEIIENDDYGLNTLLSRLGDICSNLEIDFDLDLVKDEISKIEHRFNSEEIEYDINELEYRKSCYNSFSRKYRCLPNELPSVLEKLLKEKELFSEAEEKIRNIDNKISVLSKEFNKLAKNIHEYRKKYAKKIEKKLQSELESLRMSTSFKFNIEFTDNKSSDGADKITLMIKTNKGQDFYPIESIASGGELSRIALILESNSSTSNCLIFDEVDAGIGGEIGFLIGKALSNLSKNRQVICITHLAQVAKYSNLHIKVEKEDSQDQTRSFSSKLEDDDSKIIELARLLGNPKDEKYKSLARDLIKKP
tara:strand:- start:9256 stop:10752 length:1497 start_codon:yes stop_codon:yes gene_type:complete